MNRTLLIAGLGIIALAFLGFVVVSNDESAPINDAAHSSNESLEGVVTEKGVFKNSFTHAESGDGSDIHVVATGFKPGEKTTVSLRQSGIDEYVYSGIEAIASETGEIKIDLQVQNTGRYTVEVDSPSLSATDVIVIQ